jgi:hypothetical protein
MMSRAYVFRIKSDVAVSHGALKKTGLQLLSIGVLYKIP